MQIGSLIRRAALHYGDAPCVTDGERGVTFREFDTLTDRLGNALGDAGLRPGDRVGVLLPNGIECLLAYYAVAKAGLVCVSLNTRETMDDQRYKLADSGCRAVICDEAKGTFDIDLHFDAAILTVMMRAGSGKPCAIDRPLDAPIRLAYTGGTTGKPKAVTLTTRGQLAVLSALLLDVLPDIGLRDTFLHAAPIAHASGTFFLPAIVRGMRSFVMERFDPAEFLRLAESERVTVTFLVPTMLAMIFDLQELEQSSLHFRRVVYGAAPISPTLLKRVEDRWGRILTQIYGQTESPMVITFLAPEDHDRALSCGRPFTCADVDIMDESGNLLSAGEVGEVVCRGPQLMAHYWNRPDATEAAFRGGWLHTGDIGRMDADGFFYLLDRKNDMLISGGYNVYPREVEDILLAYEGVLEAAVIGIPDEKWGERVHAVVAGRPGLNAAGLLEFARVSLANFKCPKTVDIWPELPKSSANKILRRKIRDVVLNARQ